jgi:hypothetical protein
MRKALLYIALDLLLACSAACSRAYWLLPSEQTARQQFASHKADYARFVSLLRDDPGEQFIGNDGVARDYNGRSRFVPEYRTLMEKIGVKSVLIREDGSVEFELWGFGCAICSDSYMGVRYLPLHHDLRARPGWTAELVRSLDDKELPRERGSIADGLYVVQIEPEWFIYRLEYQE